jgi:hypothetical protein
MFSFKNETKSIFSLKNVSWLIASLDIYIGRFFGEYKSKNTSLIYPKENGLITY